MYVKVSPYGHDGDDAIFATEGVAHFGKIISKAPPTERLYEDEIGASFNLLHVHMITDEASGEADGLTDAPYWAYSYAWWWENGDRIVGVVTSHRLFILSAAGDTIDRVR